MKLRIFCLLLVASYQNIVAQQCGCTDPQAANYLPSATVNDGSCKYISASILPTKSVLLPDKLHETSGIILWDNALYTLNDDVDNHIYQLDLFNGKVTNTFPLIGTVNRDWEEIAQDSNYMYVGDVGNNMSGNRTDLHILRVRKHSLQTAKPEIDTIHFAYADQLDYSPTPCNKTNFDCEAFIVTQDSIYLFTKQWKSNKTNLYALPKVPGRYLTRYCGTLDVEGLITGATYIASKRLIALCGYSKYLKPFIYLLYDFTQHDFFSANKRKMRLKLPFYQVEGIATENGTDFFISNESFSKKPFISTYQQLHTLDLTPLLGGYILSQDIK